MKKNIMKILLKFQYAIEKLISFLNWHKKDFERVDSENVFPIDSDAKTSETSEVLSSASLPKLYAEIGDFIGKNPQKNPENFSQKYENFSTKNENNFSKIFQNFGFENLQSTSNFYYNIFQNEFYLSKNIEVLSRISRLNSFLNSSGNLIKNEIFEDNFYQNFSGDFSQNLSQNFCENFMANSELNASESGVSRSFSEEVEFVSFQEEKSKKIFSRNQIFDNENYLREFVENIISDALDSSIRINGFRMN